MYDDDIEKWCSQYRRDQLKFVKPIMSELLEHDNIITEYRGKYTPDQLASIDGVPGAFDVYNHEHSNLLNLIKPNNLPHTSLWQHALEKTRQAFERLIDTIESRDPDVPAKNRNAAKYLASQDTLSEAELQEIADNMTDKELDEFLNGPSLDDTEDDTGILDVGKAKKQGRGRQPGPVPDF